MSQRRLASLPSLGSLCLLVAVVACGGDGGSGDGLERDDVVGLPAGDATGSAASGTYDLEMTIVACGGTCPVLRVGPARIATCDIGDVDYPTFEVVQTDGRLDLDAFGLVLEKLDGGLDADGSFVVGGWGTRNSGSLAVAILGSGVLAGARLTGTALARAVGDVDGQWVDCTAQYELEGDRLDR